MSILPMRSNRVSPRAPPSIARASGWLAAATRSARIARRAMGSANAQPGARDEHHTRSRDALRGSEGDDATARPRPALTVDGYGHGELPNRAPAPTAMWIAS